MLSGAFLNTSMLGIARFLGVVHGTSVSKFAHSAVVGFGIFSFVLATLFIVRQTGIKRLMAYSSVEHIGVQALGLGFGGALGIAGALYHMLNHSLNKSLMFFGAGNAMRAYGTKEISGIRQVLKVSRQGNALATGCSRHCRCPPIRAFSQRVHDSARWDRRPLPVGSGLVCSVPDRRFYRFSCTLSRHVL